ncbi:putative G-protein coupled receptor [Toxocara canis]|uniref:Putative G-protein coupled receptor n=1 Tax=Toxocara canis TaxID=6265 RepID=A0A0B2VHW3_TOXCA|nr:putative G-protein coupled receptor [Toxocara canis]
MGGIEPSSRSCTETRQLETHFSMTSVRIPWQTLDLFPSVTVLNVFWFANTNIFSNSYTLDGRWVALNQVHAVVLKRVSLKRISPADKLGGFISDSSPAIYFTYYLHIPTEQVRLGVWSNKEWRVASADECSQRRVGPRYVLIACTHAFVIAHLGENITFFTAMQNAELIERVASADECSQRRVGPRYVLIACTHAFVIAHLGENITFFTAMQNAELIERLTAVRKGIGLPWWMYMSSGFLASSMAFVVLSNVCCMKQVVSCKLLHILINLCSSILFLCVFFTLGVNKVFDEFICRISGALIHFFFLVTFYWLMLSMRTVQKKISKMASTKQQHVVDEESEQCESGKVAAHGPIAGLYFLAYGVPLFAVSFSIAIDADIAKTKNPSVPLVMDVEVKSSESSFVDEGTTTVRFQLSGFLTIALFILGACCAAVAYVRGVVTSSHSSIPIVFSVLYSLFQRSCMLLDSPLARQKNCSPIVEGVTSMTDGEASLVPQQLSNPYNATGSVLLLMQRRSVAQQGYNMNERVRRYESTEMRKLSEKAMQHTARRYYKRQRQLLTNSTAFSNVQGTTIEEETGDVVSSGDFIDVSESVNEALTDSSGLDLLHVEMDQLSEKHREIESMSSNSSHYKHMCYRQI